MVTLHRGIAGVALGALLLSALPAQSRNVALLGRYDPGERGSDVWGWVDPASGKEYALACAYDGTHVLDCSDPSNPVLTGIIPSDNPSSSNNRWRDVKVYGTHAYIVSEAHGGMQVVDLTVPDQPRKLQTFGTSLWSSAHNIAMDFENGVAYVCGTSSGMHVVDVATDPANPTHLGQYTASYVHDLSIQNGLAHTADINANRYVILDVSALPSFSQQSSTASAGSSSCHSTWPSRDNQIVAICHETSGGELVIYDISNPRLPRLLSKYQTGGPSAIVHNPMVVDRVCHISWNTEGYRSIDLSDPSNPRPVAFYDTWSGSSSGFEGMWGIYAGQPSGVIYGMDRSAGFFVFKPKSTAVRYGQATAGATEPALHTFGSAWGGNTKYRLDVAGAAPASPGVLLLGVAPADALTLGVRVLVDLGAAHGLVPVVTDAGGDAKIAMPVPEGAVSGTLYAQMLLLDATAPTGIAATRGLQFELFLR